MVNRQSEVGDWCDRCLVCRAAGMRPRCTCFRRCGLVPIREHLIGIRQIINQGGIKNVGSSGRRDTAYKE